ncbi:hypothetical protein [Flexivirga lutea]
MVDHWRPGDDEFCADQRDVEVTWPLLDAGRRDWLRDMLQRTLPGHPCLAAT